MRLAWVFPVFLASCSFGGGKGDDPELVTRGAVCGDPSIQGVVVGEVPGNGACGIANAVEVDAVGGVLLSTPATMNCRTARTLNAWVQNDMKPIVGDTGGGVAIGRTRPRHKPRPPVQTAQPRHAAFATARECREPWTCHIRRMLQ